MTKPRTDKHTDKGKTLSVCGLHQTQFTSLTIPQSAVEEPNYYKSPVLVISHAGIVLNMCQALAWTHRVSG